MTFNKAVNKLELEQIYGLKKEELMIWKVCIQLSAGTEWKDKSEGLTYRTKVIHISTKIGKNISFNIISIEKA